ncbi:MAG: hypothetical protein IJ078_01045 [Succinivibrionaceae bacterium]|nr:hypothetical protein [Succinivibrionaceae bacterium]
MYADLSEQPIGNWDTSKVADMVVCSKMQNS